METSKKLSRFDHVVVLMLENRSFDNILGYLSTDVDGVLGKDLSNPAPINYKGDPVDGANKGPVHVSPGTVMDNPNPDPGEYFPHVNTQLYNCVAPLKENSWVDDPTKYVAPFNQPTNGTPKTVPCTQLPYPAPMSGFVQDYYNKWMATHGHDEPPTREDYSVIMNCFAKEKVPVMSGLANHFAVFDKWHCAVPSQTFCNRSFFNAATSHGRVVNTPYHKWLGEESDSETIFNRLEDNKQTWVIYYDKEDVFPLTLLLHFKKLWHFFKHHHSRKLHFRHMEDFHDDAANGNLPDYAFIEPRLFLNHNDMHPPIKILGIPQRSTVTAGEALVHEVYTAIKNSGSPGNGHTKATGSHSENTLLTITYDEHGGCYDHVSPPPCATPPGDHTQPQMGFGFDRLGIRVPTIMISAYIDAQVVHTPMQHTAMLKTLSTKWGFNPLTKRDASAPDFSTIFNREHPLAGKDWPPLTPLAQPLEALATDNSKHPLNDLQLGILQTILAIGTEKEAPTVANNTTVCEAIRQMRTKLEALTS